MQIFWNGLAVDWSNADRAQEFGGGWRSEEIRGSAGGWLAADPARIDPENQSVVIPPNLRATQQHECHWNRKLSHGSRGYLYKRQLDWHYAGIPTFMTLSRVSEGLRLNKRIDGRPDAILRRM